VRDTLIGRLVLNDTVLTSFSTYWAFMKYPCEKSEEFPKYGDEKMT
jgi:hypothetical protein